MLDPRRHAPGLLLLTAVLTLTSQTSCSSSTETPRSAPAPATGSTQPRAGSSAIGLGPGTNPDPLPLAGQTAPPVLEDECNNVEIEFAPRVPAVFILVDRSSSMFERSFWDPLKDGVLAVIEQLDDDIRFGFSTYTGRPMQCPELSDVVPLAEKNSGAIEQAYERLAAPEFKGETPTALAITEVVNILKRESADTPKYILLVTDGEPDFCDDPNVTCSRDAVVSAVQQAYGQGIGTFIFSIGGDVDPAHLSDVANAGTGQPVADRQMAVFYQCPNSSATYSAASGNAPYFEPDVNDRAALTAALSSTIAGVRSCVFDLQGQIAIDLAMADQGTIAIDGMQVPYGEPDGYRMNTETQLELLGGSCQRLKRPETKAITVDFPCEAVELL